MKSRSSLPRFRSVARVMLVAGAVAAAGACHEPLDTTKTPGPKATFGDDLYGVMCDRLAADILREDLTGASYQEICHYDDEGQYGNEVDVSLLPPPSSKASKEARRISLAKMNALVSRRSDLVKAFNATFPDIEIDNVKTDKEGDTVNLLVAMMDLGQHVSELYELNPYDVDPLKDPLAPQTTRALGALFDSVGKSEAARGMLQRMWARRGYRPANVGLGITGKTLEYPDLRDFTTAAVTLLGPNGAATPELKQMLRVTQQKMLWMTPEVFGLPELSVAAPTAQPNRPRTTIEMLRELMLTEDERFAPDSDAPARYIALRDRRGYVVPAAFGSTFSDGDGDGYADVDAFGRFIAPGGASLDLDTPFSVPGIPSFGERDGFGRPVDEIYQYVDTSRTPAASISLIMTPLLDATEYADPADPNAFMSEYETLMYALAGANVLLGAREDVEYDFETGKVVPLGTDCDACFEYKRFRGEDSPLVDLAYAAGQIIGDTDSDAVLLGLIDLAENHEAELARLLAAALRVREISAEHDVMAANGQILPAELPYEVPIWDEAAQPLSRIAEEPRLMSNLLRALADPVIVSQIGSSAHMGDTVALFASTIDGFTYDKNDLNGPALNTTDGGFSIQDPHNLMDFNAPHTGANRSILEQTILLIQAASGAHTCNKNGAVVRANVFGITLEWPLVGSPYTQCELFQIDDLAAFYFGSVIDANHPKRSEFVLKSNALNGIMDAIGFISSPDEMFEESSGITGMTTHPTAAALDRLVYFGASSDAFPNMPDFDALNSGTRTNDFISNLMDPTATKMCGTSVICADQNDTMRIRTKNSIFTWERAGFLVYMRPIITAFVNVGCSEDVTICDTTNIQGERMFLDLSEAFWRHYPGPDHGSECTGSVDRSDPRYCSGAGLNRYEPIIEKAMRTDLIPALHEFAVAAHDVSQITIARGPKAGQTLSGAQVLEITTRILLSQDYAASKGLTTRNGEKTATWTDGTVQAQVTPFNIFSDAFHKMDVMFDQAGDGELRKAQWKRARSQLVDVLLATEGTGADTRFKIRGMAPLLATTLRLVREQVNAHCPERESGAACEWAKTDLATNLAEALSSPLTAAAVDLGEQLRIDPNARRALERYLTYMLANVGEGAALQGTLASMVDIMQVLTDDEKLVPIMRAASVAMEPEKGCADTTIKFLKALSGDEYDRYHVMDHVLQNLVTPMPDENGAPGSSPIEIYMDVIAEVHRADPTDPAAPLDPTDYQYIMTVMRDFMTSETRGLEQIYAIVKRRKRP